MDITIDSSEGLKEFILDLFFPNRCPFCGGFIRFDRLCCEECFSEMLWTDEYVCGKCGKPRRPDCLCSEHPAYDLCVSATYYDGKAKKGIYSLKFMNNLNGAAVFGRALREKLEITGVLDDISVCVPVPMSEKQKRQRGYNQAEELAKVILKGTDIPIRNDLIFRNYSKTAQHFLGAEDRKAAAEKTYYTTSKDSPLSGMTVLLTDDVLTTGSTLNKCAALLKELGAERVICAAAATV